MATFFASIDDLVCQSLDGNLSEKTQIVYAPPLKARRKVLDQLEGFEAPAASWEGDIFSSRLKNYDHTWMDTLCLFGSAAWGGFELEISAEVKNLLR